MWVAAAINLLVFVLATVLARSLTPSRAASTSSASQQTVFAGRSWILPLVSISGAVSFTWEILWTRLLSHLVGSSVYAFATMLATFLLGLALGSALAARLATTVERARRGFVLA